MSFSLISVLELDPVIENLEHSSFWELGGLIGRITIQHPCCSVLVTFSPPLELNSTRMFSYEVYNLLTLTPLSAKSYYEPEQVKMFLVEK